MLRKILATMLAGAATFFFGASAFALDTSLCTYEQFKVTAYYSPEAGQDFYYRGNLTDEIILNGKGTHGASGAPVYNGMLAAPNTYAFGTKIYFPGRGVGVVDDRGGAIVNKGERADATQTRIDIRAGRGEEGLKRALSFGVQYIDGWVCPPGTLDAAVGIDYSVFPHYDDFFHASLWVMALWPERQDPWVAALQNYLIALGYLGEGKSTGYYGRETKAAVCKYQQDYLGTSGSSEWCGYFGPQTRYDMKLRLKQRGFSNLSGPDGSLIHNSVSGNEAPVVQDILLSNAGEVAITTPTREPETVDERIIEHLFTSGEFAHFQFAEVIEKGDEGKVVRILQRKLQWLGFLPKDMKISGVYDMQTIEAMYIFQLEMGILNGREDVGVRGYFGQKTREVMNNL